MHTRKSSEVAISSSMSLSDASKALVTIGGMGKTMQRLELRDNEIVVFLRKPNLTERFKMALMPSQMRREARSLVGLVLKEIELKTKNPSVSADLINIRDAIESRDSRLLEKAFLMQCEHLLMPF